MGFRGAHLLVVFSFLITGLQPKIAMADQTLIDFVQKQIHSGQINLNGMLEIRKQVFQSTDSFGRVTPQLQAELLEVEGSFGSFFDQDASLEFQTIAAEIGAKVQSPIQLPRDDTPFWLMDSGEFATFRSSDRLPKKADVVVIGAGLTGSSAAYHLRELARAGHKVVVLEAGQPASQASGRNGGNFQLLSESYFVNYDGLVQERVKWILSQNPEMNRKEVLKLAQIQVTVLLQFNYHNFRRFFEIINREKIECDFSSEGWLRIASNQSEEDGIQRDIDLIRALDIPAEILSPQEIQKRLKIPAQFAGRFIPKNGNYHPYKFVVGLLKTAIKDGVELYTGVKVNQIREDEAGKVLIETSEGIIETSKVILATNAFSSKLFPELESIYTVPSQIINLEHAQNNLQGLTVTEQNGDIYYNFPVSRMYQDEEGVSRGMVHLGLDFEYSVTDPDQIARSESLFQKMKLITDERFPDTRFQPPTRVWVGPMAYTPDKVPVIGFLHFKETPNVAKKNIVVAAGFQGYGGSYCIQAGYVAAEMAVTGETHEDVPEFLFSPKRFLKR